ncbi:MAG: UvrD-helicase domain-containing protein, partial [Terrimicrobiaceae bacterium]
MPKSRIDDLNREQLRATTAGEGPVLTIARAGTGKTKTLAARVAWLVSQGIDPGRIMLLTFTRRASEEMLRRARRALGETGSRTLGTVWGGTFTPWPTGCCAPTGKPSGSIRILPWWISRMPRI